MLPHETGHFLFTRYSFLINRTQWNSTHTINSINLIRNWSRILNHYSAGFHSLLNLSPQTKIYSSNFSAPPPQTFGGNRLLYPTIFCYHRSPCRVHSAPKYHQISANLHAFQSHAHQKCNLLFGSWRQKCQNDKLWY